MSRDSLKRILKALRSGKYLIKALSLPPPLVAAAKAGGKQFEPVKLLPHCDRRAILPNHIA
jgi:hypothetical protein